MGHLYRTNRLGGQGSAAVFDLLDQVHRSDTAVTPNMHHRCPLGVQVDAVRFASLALAMVVVMVPAQRAPARGNHRVVGRDSATTHVRTRTLVKAAERLELRGTVVLDAGSELVALPGAVLAFGRSARLVVGRDARIRLDGTALQPIVLTCTEGPRQPGCWDGVVINGHAPVNIGQQTSPPARGSGAAGCREITAGSAFGGCNAADSSGVLRYVRVEYATTGLQLRGVGSRTVAAHLQVHRSAADGIRIEGGAVRLARVWSTANAGHGLVWTSGWQGDAQSLVVSQDPDASAGGIEGRNTDSGDPNALPRSAPRLYNVTVLAGSNLNNPSHNDPPSSIRLARGTGGTLRNVLLYRPYSALDVDDDATCAQLVAGSLLLEHVLVATPYSAVSPDVEPSSCTTGGAGEMDLLTRASAGNSVVTDANASALMMVRPDDSLLRTCACARRAWRMPTPQRRHPKTDGSMARLDTSGRYPRQPR